MRWKDVKGYEGLYKISPSGKVWTCRKQRLKVPSEQNSGYLLVFLVKDGKRKAYLLHRLVAENFIDNPNGFAEVNHKDGDKKNNAVSNLEWCSRGDNLRHRARVLGQRGRARKVLCKETGQVFNAIKDAAIWAGVTSATIRQSIIKGDRRKAGGYTWKSV
jgi:hypothetical protein